jgi:DNA repair exonuclease SbcCD nuclease subunit
MEINPYYKAIAPLEPAEGITRIIIAHGTVDSFTPKKDDPLIISTESLENVINENKASFIALGDRHLRTKIGAGERIWYSGTPEVTDFGEEDSGYAQVIEMDGGNVEVIPYQVGQWRFIEKKHIDINHTEDIEALRQMLEDLDQKERTIIKVNLVGSISLTQEGVLRQSLDSISEVFASFQINDTDLLVVPDDADFSNLGFSGFVETTVAQLRGQMTGETPEKQSARDALMLLLRLRGAIV